MDFYQRMPKNPTGVRFSEDGYYVWCGAMFRYRNSYYLAYSRWKRELGFAAWVTDCEICLAKTDTPLGEFHYIKTIRTKDDRRGWDADCVHNPTILAANGRFYLYYMGNYGDGTFWNHRNHQRIGVMSADNPEGEWSHSDKPLLDVSDEGFDSLMVSNPSVTQRPDGKFVMVYKAVSKYGELPKGGAVICGVALSDFPDRGFVKTGKPVMVNPENDWSVEDPFIWCEDGRLWAVVKDFHGWFTHTGKCSVALFSSKDGVDWCPAEHPLAFPIFFEGKEVARLERPQLYIENGRPQILICACVPDIAGTPQNEYKDVFSVRIPLKYQK